MPIAQLARHSLWYDTAGLSGAPVLLIMGYTMRGTAWEPQTKALAAHHRVAWYDHAGIGSSGPIAVPDLRMEHMADDALDLLDHLVWPQAHVVGISMGGMIAQHLALRSPHRVRSLTLVATHAGGLGRALPSVEGMRQFAMANFARGESRIDALCRLLYARDYLQVPDQFEAARSRLRNDFGQPPSAQARRAQLGAILRHRTARRLAELEGLPVLVVRPGQDVLIRPEASDELHRRIPGSRLERFDDSGHGLTRQCADRFNQLVLKHFADADARLTASRPTPEAMQPAEPHLTPEA